MDAATAAPPTRPEAVAVHTARGSKTVYLIRHGVARHNVPDVRTGARPNILDPEFTDPPLIRQGELQARALGEQLRRQGFVRAETDAGDGMDEDDDTVAIGRGGRVGPQTARHPIELVVCSPLTRCLQTASHMFPSYFTNEKHPVSTITVDDGNKVENVHVLNRKTKVCCHGDSREAYGMHYPDKRSPLSQLKYEFSTVAYHPALTEHDTEWQPHARETRHEVSMRVQKLFTWLLHQPHDGIAIVTHGVWIECALSHDCPQIESGRKRVHNCEVYGGRLSAVAGGSRAEVQNDAAGSVGLTNVEQLSFYQG